MGCRLRRRGGIWLTSSNLRDWCRGERRWATWSWGCSSASEGFPATGGGGGGGRRRLSIPRPLGVEPDIIMMDEPLSALDAQTKLRLRDEILRIWRETQKTVVYVTHDIDEALYLADKVIVFSSKPTKIISTTLIDRPRPRDVEGDVELRRRKAEIF